MPEKYCQLCRCTGAKEEGMPKGLDKNWACPLLGKKICLVCCEIELEGGMGAPDTLEDVMKITGKSPREIHQTCVACPHGGPDLEKPPKLVSIRGKDGKQKTRGAEFELAQKESISWFMARIKRLKSLGIIPTKAKRKT